VGKYMVRPLLSLERLPLLASLIRNSWWPPRAAASIFTSRGLLGQRSRKPTSYYLIMDTRKAGW